MQTNTLIEIPPTATAPIADVDTLKAEYLTARQDVEEITKVISLRRRPLQEKIVELNKAFEAENAELFQLLETRQSDESEFERRMRDMAVEHFIATGNKSLDANLCVQVRKKLIYDEARAMEWAATNAPVMIVRSIDRKMFESFPGIEQLDFVEVESSVSSVIKGLK